MKPITIFIMGFWTALSIPAWAQGDSSLVKEQLFNQARARLATLYTAEKAFFAEYGTYTTDLVAAGVELPESPYVCGFFEPFRELPMGYTGDFDPERRVIGKPVTYLPVSSTASKYRFLAACVSADGVDNYDIWTIDQNKNIRHVH